MAAQTISAWSTSSVNGLVKHKCTTLTDATNLTNYTLKTPDKLDPTKPWTLIVENSADTDGAATAIDLWLGLSDKFLLAGTTSKATATDGFMYAEILDDIGYSAAGSVVIQMNPVYTGLANIVALTNADTGLRFNVPIAPYYAFELHAASGTLLAHTLTWTILQKI